MTSLRTQEYKVIFANNASNGLSLAASGCPDLILLDLGLPDMDGIDVIKSIREWSNIPTNSLSLRLILTHGISAEYLGRLNVSVKEARILKSSVTSYLNNTLGSQLT